MSPELVILSYFCVYTTLLHGGCAYVCIVVLHVLIYFLLGLDIDYDASVMLIKLPVASLFVCHRSIPVESSFLLLPRPPLA